MVTKNEIKFIKSLTSKRVRNKLKLFVVEGEKSINEFLKFDYKVYKIYSINPSTFSIPEKVVEISDKQLSQISSFKTPNKHLAVFKQVEVSLKNKNIYFILDNVNDPGNLGTIIRTIDWFGYNQLIYQQLCLQLKRGVRHGNTSLIEKGTQPEYGIVATRTRSHSYK